MLHSFKKYKGLAVVPAFALLLAACGGGQPAQQDQGGAATEAPTFDAGTTIVEGGVTGGEVIWAQMSDPASLDPIRSSDAASTHVLQNVMQGLTVMNPTVSHVSLEPALAASWEHVSPYEWIFNLRQGVYFHDGAYFDADVVVMNLERALNPVEATPQIVIIEMIDEVIALDTYTVQINTNIPFAPLASNLAHRVTFMVSPYVLAQSSPGSDVVMNNPIGTGPFVFYNQVPGDYIRLVRNENYWGIPASPDSVLIRTIPEPATRMAMLEAGDAHFVFGMPADLGVSQQIPQIDTRLIRSSSLDYIGLNMDHPVLSDIRVRQAIAMAFDHDAALYGLAEGLGETAHGPAAPILAHAPQGQRLPRDIERARELIQEAGAYGTVLQYTYNSGNSFRSTVGQLLQYNLAEIGLTLEITGMEWTSYLDHTASGNHEIFMLGWVISGGDTDGIYSLFHGDVAMDGGNRFNFRNDEVSYMLDRARQSTDGAERDRLYEEITTILNYEVPALWVRFQHAPILSNGIDNMHVDFAMGPWFRDVTFR